MIQNTPQKVFVYGTLKSGYGNNRSFLGTSRKLGAGSIYGAMIHLGGFPGLVPDTHCRVIGEVYEVDWSTMNHLDRLEGVPTLYERRQIEMGGYGRVWTYYYANPPALLATTEVVSHGLWRGSRMDKCSYADLRAFWDRQEKANEDGGTKVISLPTVLGRVTVNEPGFEEVIKGETPPAILAGAVLAAASIRRVVTEPTVGPGLEEM